MIALRNCECTTCLREKNKCIFLFRATTQNPPVNYFVSKDRFSPRNDKNCLGGEMDPFTVTIDNPFHPFSAVQLGAEKNGKVGNKNCGETSNGAVLWAPLRSGDC